MHNCSRCFRDYVTKCQTAIKFHALLEPQTTYSWIIEDKFANQYEGAFTTDSNGFWQIPVASLPGGMLNQYNGLFTVRVQAADCKPRSFKIADEFDCIEIEIRGGTSTKDTIGCTFECESVVGASSELIPFANAIIFDVTWTPARLAAYTNSPSVQVHHLVGGTTYQLVSVPVERTFVDGVLTKLSINNGIAKTGYVLIN